MPQSKEAHRKTARESARRKRGSTSGVNKMEGSTAGVNTEGSQEYPANMKPLLTALGDKDKRSKLKAIYDSLDRRDLTPHVRYGINGVTFNVVGELLEAF